jgi:hypothetical protein
VLPKQVEGRARCAETVARVKLRRTFALPLAAEQFVILNAIRN